MCAAMCSDDIASLDSGLPEVNGQGGVNPDGINGHMAVIKVKP